jgi:hypothetical protein
MLTQIINNEKSSESESESESEESDYDDLRWQSFNKLCDSHKLLCESFTEMVSTLEKETEE